MYLVFFGDNRKKVRDAVTAYIEKNFPEDGSLTTLDDADYQPGQLSDALGATSLFGGVEWFILDNPSGNADFKAETEKSLAAMSESPNTFIVLEGKLAPADKKRYEKYATLQREFCAEKGGGFNNFALADALVNKDKRRLWLLWQEARLSGVREEEVIGILWWQLKTLRLAGLTKNAKAAGMKEFPYNKAKRGLAKFTGKELDNLSHSLLELYHDSRAGLKEIDTALEKWILKL